MEHFVLSVVKAERIPGGVLASPGIGMEILVWGAVEASDAFVLVLYSMRMDYIHNHGYAELVRFVYQFLEVFGSAEAA